MSAILLVGVNGEKFLLREEARVLEIFRVRAEFSSKSSRSRHCMQLELDRNVGFEERPIPEPKVPNFLGIDVETLGHTAPKHVRAI